MYKAIQNCRACGNKQLVPVLDLGQQALTGHFPKQNENVPYGPLVLVKCDINNEASDCGLLQLGHNYQLNMLYGDQYGYRSGLNASMVKHLSHKAEKIKRCVALKPGDLIIDIGSNDGTSLGFYSEQAYRRIGVDPTAQKFKSYYPKDVEIVPDFFSSEVLKPILKGEKAKVITSFSMFYDLEAPVEFAQTIEQILADEGIWVLEQSYMPLMLERNSYDTICHEHLEYYGLTQLKWILEKARLKIIDIEFNDINGGSISVVAAKAGASLNVASDKINQVLADEKKAQLDTLAPYQAFAKRVVSIKEKLIHQLAALRQEGASIMALGASTKGNVILQYCGFSQDDIHYVGEVNNDKYGCFTPGTNIPIIPEDDVLAKNPDYLLILPWHFKHFFESSEKFSGLNNKFIYPIFELN